MRIALVAGEASGDALGAGLIDALRQRFPGAQFAGVAGPRMIAAGCQAWFHSEQLGVMGLTEVLRHLPRILRLRSALQRRILEWRPDVFIGVDFKEFNLGLARRLKKQGLRTVQYVSPQVWAWRPGRARTIGEATIVVGRGRSGHAWRPTRNTRSAACAACVRPRAVSDGPGTDDPHLVPPDRRALVTRGAHLVIAGGVLTGTWRLGRDGVTVSWFAEAGPAPQDALADEVERLSALLARPLALTVDEA